uniref:Trigger factor ribosome-binding bacterial domain-containing protein n=1 Tax=Cucumis sativus TaxID=3659 RepID=A0A0A0KEX9_CUCSA
MWYPLLKLCGIQIPRDILLEILGPSKVYKQVIKEVINFTVAAYVEQEALKVRKDLRIDQSYEDLEDQSEPDGKFFFESIIQLKESN